MERKWIGRDSWRARALFAAAAVIGLWACATATESGRSIGESVSASIAFVQGTANSNQASGATTCSATLPSAVTAGDLIVVGVNWFSQSATASVSDTPGDAYQSAVGPTNWSGASYRAQVFYAKNVAGGTNTVTVHLSGGSNAGCEIYVEEYSGVDRVSPLDQSAVATGTDGQTPSSGARTTTNASELVFGYAESGGSISGPGAGFTTRSTQDGNLVEDKTVSTTGSYAATFAGSNQNWIAAMATFKAANPSTDAGTSGVSDAGWNPIAYVQGTADSDTSSGATTCSATLPEPAAAGDLIVVGANWFSQAASGKVSDTRGDAYQSAVGPTDWSGTSYRAQLFYAKSVAGGTTTVTVSLTGGTNSGCEMYVEEYSGLDRTAPLDQTAEAIGPGNQTPSSGARTTTQSNELILGYGESATAITGAGAGFQTRSTYNSNLVEDEFVTAVGSYAATFAGSGQDWFAAMATFKAAPASDGSSSSSGGGDSGGGSSGGGSSSGGSSDAGSLSDAGLPSGVTLRQIDGSGTYYASHGYTVAANRQWDSPSYYPIGSFLGSLRSDTIASWLDLGWTNGFTIDGSSDYSLANSNGISVLSNYGATVGSETVGWDADDEPQSFCGTEPNVCNGIETEPNAQQAGRFWWLNVTWNQIQYGSVAGTPGDATYADMYFSPISMPSGGTKQYGAASNDFYFISGAAGANYYLGVLYNLGNDATVDQMRRGFLYGDYIDAQRALLGVNADGSGEIPIWSLVETGGPYSQDTTAASYIQPAELNQAVWMSIMHGARGLIYFDHSFAGPEQSDNNMFDPYYQTASNFPNTGGYANPTGVSMYAQVKATDALVKQLAPVINSPFAVNYVTATPAAVTCLLPCQTNGSSVFTTVGVDVAAKWYTGGGALADGAYIFASPRASETAKNISATFTVKDTSATSVTVVNEGRNIAINGSHQFTDVFATGLTVHIYQVNH